MGAEEGREFRSGANERPAVRPSQVGSEQADGRLTAAERVAAGNRCGRAYLKEVQRILAEVHEPPDEPAKGTTMDFNTVQILSSAPKTADRHRLPPPTRDIDFTRFSRASIFIFFVSHCLS